MRRKKKKKGPTITTAAARKALKKEQDDRARVCGQELQELMKKHRCRLSVSMVITEERAIPQIKIIADPSG